MALIKSGAIVNDIRGSQNGITFSRNKGGAYVRQKVSGVQPRTPAQLAVRQNFSLNTKLWSGSMSDAQRTAWNAYAASYPYVNVFGDASVLNGLAMSVAKNQVLLQIGEAAILDPPADNSVDAIPDVSSAAFASGPDTITLTTAAQDAAADTSYYVFATPSLPPGITPSESRYRFLGVYAPVAAAVAVGVPATVGADWITRFGDPLAGQCVWFIIAQVSISKGNLTVGQKFKALVT